MSNRSAFERDWRISPGETVRAIMASRDMLDGDVGARLDLTLEGLADLIGGRIAIDRNLADRLAEVFGPSSRFWLNRETLYRQPPQATPPEGLAGEQSAFIARLPVPDMRRLGWIDAYDRNSRQDIVLGFFEDDYGDWRRNGRDLLEAVAFRTSPFHVADPAAVAAWLRQGVRQARDLPCSDWNPEGLVHALDSIRALTREKNPSVFFPKLVHLGRRHGVAIVCVRTPAGCRASGATHFAPWGVPIVQLSFRHRSDDHFWFTLMHESAHLLLHVDGPSRSFVESLDRDDAGLQRSTEEDAANRFASETLLPSAMLPTAGSPTQKDVLRLSVSANVSPGVVVGQLQHAGLVDYSRLNHLKRRYRWDGPVLAAR